MHKKHLVLPFMILITAVVAGIGCSGDEGSQTTSKPGSPDSLTTTQPLDSLVIELSGVDSMTVFDLLVKSHEVDYFSTAAGVFVRGIDTIANSDNYFWLYSVDDEMPRVAADRYLTRNGAVVRWHYRRINK